MKIDKEKFIKDIVLSFSLRRDYKTLISGIISEEEKLYFKQLEMSEQIYKETYSSGKRAIKKLDYFNYDNKDKKYNIYDNVIRFYTYINSFPKIKEFESDIREFKANEIVKSNINTMNSIKKYNQNAREYNNKIERGFIKLAVKRENNNLETDYKKIIPTIKNVFREEDIFMKEAIEFLSSKYSNEFGKDTWTISGNAVIWLEPNDNICFDVRRKVKPSKNGMNSIYKIVYNKENANRFSLNRYNLRALITSILINGDLSFKDLKDTATNNLKVKNHNSENTNNLSQDLKNKIPNWNRYKKASLIVKTVRKSIIKDIHLHNKDSVGFYKEFIRILYKLDSGNSNIYDNVVEIINKYGIPNENLSEEIIKLLKYNNLKDMALASVDILVSIKKKKEIKQSIASFKTWSKFAFLPVNQKNQNIYSLLGWENIKNNLLTENSKADIFEILFNYFKKNNIAIPTIVGIYQNYIKNNKINYYEEKEIKETYKELSDRIAGSLIIGNDSYFPEGVDYHESSDYDFGGRNNNDTIGNKLREEGNYNVDYFSILKDGKIVYVESNNGKNLNETINKVSKALNCNEEELQARIHFGGEKVTGWTDFDDYKDKTGIKRKSHTEDVYLGTTMGIMEDNGKNAVIINDNENKIEVPFENIGDKIDGKNNKSYVVTDIQNKESITKENEVSNVDIGFGKDSVSIPLTMAGALAGASLALAHEEEKKKKLDEVKKKSKFAQFKEKLSKKIRGKSL